ncbi:hypothetical protein [Mycobacterium gastri]|uniref:Uncharacterized protein n=1 Tax=Mycobacterium gastri TaxID=1777 RepID=A0A1X1VKB4_MYCGS|nr:hypothetical protein [Mycobacterium gastri]ETW24558.1 hypothetical protein MGAST_07770 [Mycobacterium gastri 'Wayne']ORV69454.1 hypothetical protein AWC07_00605 [Mycobacterium gastri]
MSQAAFALRAHNPDVLTCIANLSNDEVFTPPEMANAMLGLLAKTWAAAHDGADLWTDPTVTFLDPFTKSGVFLREIVRRLTDGLASTPTSTAGSSSPRQPAATLPPSTPPARWCTSARSRT